MALLVVSHLAAGGLALGLGLLVSGLSPASLRRRSALRWAFQRARAEAERAREREASARAELDAALKREVAARDEAEQSKALAAVLEAEMVAARWEKEELEQRARPDQQALDNAQAVAALEVALRKAVPRAPREVVWPEAADRDGKVVQLVRFSAAASRAVVWAGPRAAAPVGDPSVADG